MKKWVIAASGIVVIIAIVATVAFVFTLVQESEISSPRNGNASPLLPERPGTSNEVGTGSQTSRSIEEVKEAWEEQLMAMPGVMGVGIGLAKNGQEKVIKVYVNRLAALQVARIPTQIEGYLVEVEIRGTFRAW